jgi:hypothetical protein
MKKLLLVLAIGAFVASCNDSGTAEAPKTDTTATTPDTATTVTPDTSAVKADTSAVKVDTTKK